MGVKNLLDLTGKVALITGGSRGLGLQIGEALGEMGAKLLITARKAAGLEQACAHFGKLGSAVTPIASDLSKPESIPSMVEKVIEQHGVRQRLSIRCKVGGKFSISISLRHSC